MRHEGALVGEAATAAWLGTRQVPFVFRQVVLHVVLKDLRGGEEFVARRTPEGFGLNVSTHVHRNLPNFHDFHPATRHKSFDGMLSFVVVHHRREFPKLLLNRAQTALEAVELGDELRELFSLD